MSEPTMSGLSGRTILVAHDLSGRAAAATRVAALLAAERGAKPVVVRVLDPGAYPVPAPIPGLLAMADAMLGEGAHEAQVAELRETIAASVPEAAGWPAYVRIGTPAVQIAAEAERHGAALIVMGLHAHGRAARVFRDETTLRVMRLSAVPVLAMSEGSDALPRRAVVGVDFGRASATAARAVLPVLAPGGTLSMIYARIPASYESEDELGRGVVEAHGIAGAFAELHARLAELPEAAGVTIETKVMDEIDPATALLEVAEQERAELIAVASHRHDTLDRWLLGTVTARLARDGSRSLLVVPPSPERPVERRGE
ncbi:MAG TPA: universal stress protein [Gemmatimonadaceae bacterium]|nr:universal stress protein [Gemmatimonadaceae bacterium]